MVTAEDLEKRLQENLRNVRDISSVMKITAEHLVYSMGIYDDLDQGAKVVTDELYETLEKYSTQLLENLPDSPLKRQGLRNFAIAGGQHFDIEAHIKELETPPLKISDNLIACIKIHTNGLRNISDLIFDVTQNTLSGSASFSQLILLSMCVDELLVALHLLKHRYINQAYSHIRSVFENLDKIELFRTQPEWAEVWTGNDEKKKWDELRPIEVRKKLGKERHDRLYSLFSSLGVHATFKGAQLKAIRKYEEGEKRASISIWVGSSPLEENTVWASTFAIYALFSLLIQLMRSFESFLNVEECRNILERIYNEFKEYFLNHFLAWAKSTGHDVRESEKFFQDKPWESYLKK